MGRKIKQSEVFSVKYNLSSFKDLSFLYTVLHGRRTLKTLLEICNGGLIEFVLFSPRCICKTSG